MDKRSLVLGTSNGIILDGYPSAIREWAEGSAVANLSLGASASVFLAYRLRVIEQGSAAVGFIETAVNDAAAIRVGAYGVERMVESLEAAVVELQSRGVRPIALIIPGRTLDVHTETVVETQRTVFARLGVECLDGFRTIKQSAERSGLGYDQYFRDAAHLKSPVVKTLVEDFLSSLQDEPVSVASCSRRFAYLPIGDDRIEVIGGSGRVSKASLPSRKVANTLLRDELVRIGQDNAIYCAMDQGERIDGVVLNMRATSAYAWTRGDRQVVKDFRFATDPNDVKLIVAGFVAPVAPRAGRIEIRFKKSPGEPLERTYHGDTASVATGAVELAGLVVSNAEPAAPPSPPANRAAWTGAPKLHDDLARLVSL